jgi:hypothetical protein
MRIAVDPHCARVEKVSRTSAVTVEMAERLIREKNVGFDCRRVNSHALAHPTGQLRGWH